jgi:hypothetical protein
MRANINGKSNNPNYLKVSKLTGVHRKTLKSWWENPEKYASAHYKNSRFKLETDKFKGKFPDMKNSLDEWAQELRLFFRVYFKS